MLPVNHIYCLMLNVDASELKADYIAFGAPAVDKSFKPVALGMEMYKLGNVLFGYNKPMHARQCIAASWIKLLQQPDLKRYLTSLGSRTTYTDALEYTNNTLIKPVSITVSGASAGKVTPITFSDGKVSYSPAVVKWFGAHEAFSGNYLVTTSNGIVKREPLILNAGATNSFSLIKGIGCGLLIDATSVDNLDFRVLADIRIPYNFDIQGIYNEVMSGVYVRAIEDLFKTTNINTTLAELNGLWNSPTDVLFRLSSVVCAFLLNMEAIRIAS